MRAKDYKAEKTRTVSFFLSSVFLPSCVVELAIAEMACVSSNVRRTFHVPSGVPVQRSISERDVSHPVVELRKAETTSTSTNIRTTRSESFALFVSSDSFLNAFLHILIIPLQVDF